MSDKDDKVIRVIEQWIPDGVLISDDVICQADILIGTDNTRFFI